eukprot:5970583-Prorocentrum_lima.AAC.1
MFASLKKAKDDLDRERLRRERVSFGKNAAPSSTPPMDHISGPVGSFTAHAQTTTKTGSILKPAP